MEEIKEYLKENIIKDGWVKEYATKKGAILHGKLNHSISCFDGELYVYGQRAVTFFKTD